MGIWDVGVQGGDISSLHQNFRRDWARKRTEDFKTTFGVFDVG